MHPSFVKSARNAIPLHAVRARDSKAWRQRFALLSRRPDSPARAGELCLVPGRGGIAAAVLGLGKGEDALALAAFSEQLPDGVYRLGEVPDFCGGAKAALAWTLGLYAFDHYRKPKRRNLKLVLPDGVDGAQASRLARGVYLARDLINTPPNDMGPAELAAVAQQLARKQGAKFVV